jgi:sporulation protein YtfJ
MAEHPIQGLMNVTMDKIRQMADSNTIIGKPIKTDDGTTILPVSRISFGFASAGTDFDGKNAANKDLFGGGSGAGVNIQPVAFLVVKDGCVRTIQLSDGSNTVDRALTMLPELVDKVSALLKKEEKKDAAAPRQMADSNTIIGKPIKTDDGTTILPVSRISFGFASAGTDFDGKNAANKDLFGGGSGAGVNIQPVAFLVVKDGCVRTIQLSDGSNTVDRALTMLPELVDKVSALLKKEEKKDAAAPAAPAAE